VDIVLRAPGTAVREQEAGGALRRLGETGGAAISDLIGSALCRCSSRKGDWLRPWRDKLADVVERGVRKGVGLQWRRGFGW
jgi:hypothetical protein